MTVIIIYSFLRHTATYVCLSNGTTVFVFFFRQFLHELEACAKNPDDVPKVILRHVSDYDVKYLLNYSSHSLKSNDLIS